MSFYNLWKYQKTFDFLIFSGVRGYEIQTLTIKESKLRLIKNDAVIGYSVDLRPKYKVQEITFEHLQIIWTSHPLWKFGSMTIL